MSSSFQPKYNISKSALVCEDRVEIIGDVTISSRTLIHPNVKIIAEAGPIIIGENNLIEEQTIIINKKKAGEDENSNIRIMIIGDNNVFEVGSYSECLKIGDNNIIESKARIGREVTISNGCIIGARCELNTSEVLQDNTVIYGPNNQRRIANEKPQSHLAQLDFLSKLLPSYQKFKKPTAK